MHTCDTNSYSPLTPTQHKHTQCTQTETDQIGLSEEGDELHLFEKESSIFGLGDNNATVGLKQRQRQGQVAFETHQASNGENEAKNNGQGIQGQGNAKVDGFYQMTSLREGEAGGYSRRHCSSQSASMTFRACN